MLNYKITPKIFTRMSSKQLYSYNENSAKESKIKKA